MSKRRAHIMARALRRVGCTTPKIHNQTVGSRHDPRKAITVVGKLPSGRTYSIDVTFEGKEIYGGGKSHESIGIKLGVAQDRPAELHYVGERTDRGWPNRLAARILQLAGEAPGEPLHEPVDEPKPEPSSAPATKHATTYEPPPVPTDETPVWEMVVADMQARDAEGRRKYGTPLQVNNGRNHAVDAYQEALDLAVCLRALIEANKAKDAELEEAKARIVQLEANLRGAHQWGWDNGRDEEASERGDLITHYGDEEASWDSFADSLGIEAVDPAGTRHAQVIREEGSSLMRLAERVVQLETELQETRDDRDSTKDLRGVLRHTPEGWEVKGEVHDVLVKTFDGVQVRVIPEGHRISLSGTRGGEEIPGDRSCVRWDMSVLEIVRAAEKEWGACAGDTADV